MAAISLSISNKSSKNKHKGVPSNSPYPPQSYLPDHYDDKETRRKLSVVKQQTDNISSHNTTAVDDSFNSITSSESTGNNNNNMSRKVEQRANLTSALGDALLNRGEGGESLGGSVHRRNRKCFRHPSSKLNGNTLTVSATATAVTRPIPVTGKVSSIPAHRRIARSRSHEHNNKRSTKAPLRTRGSSNTSVQGLIVTSEHSRVKRAATKTKNSNDERSRPIRSSSADVNVNMTTTDPSRKVARVKSASGRLSKIEHSRHQVAPLESKGTDKANVTSRQQQQQQQQRHTPTRSQSSVQRLSKKEHDKRHVASLGSKGVDEATGGVTSRQQRRRASLKSQNSEETKTGSTHRSLSRHVGQTRSVSSLRRASSEADDASHCSRKSQQIKTTCLKSEISCRTQAQIVPDTGTDSKSVGRKVNNKKTEKKEPLISTSTSKKKSSSTKKTTKTSRTKSAKAPDTTEQATDPDDLDLTPIRRNSKPIARPKTLLDEDDVSLVSMQEFDEADAVRSLSGAAREKMGRVPRVRFDEEFPELPLGNEFNSETGVGSLSYRKSCSHSVASFPKSSRSKGISETPGTSGRSVVSFDVSSARAEKERGPLLSRKKKLVTRRFSSELPVHFSPLLHRKGDLSGQTDAASTSATKSSTHRKLLRPRGSSASVASAVSTRSTMSMRSLKSYISAIKRKIHGNHKRKEKMEEATSNSTACWSDSEPFRGQEILLTRKQTGVDVSTSAHQRNIMEKRAFLLKLSSQRDTDLDDKISRKKQRPLREKLFSPKLYFRKSSANSIH